MMENLVPKWAKTGGAWTKSCVVGGALVFALAGCGEESVTPDAGDAPDAESSESTTPERRTGAVPRLDGGGCPEGAYLAWASPGCGDQAPEPKCIYNTDACAQIACSCEGEDIIGCGDFSTPYVSLGGCEPLLAWDGAVTDAPFPESRAEVCGDRGSECTVVARTCDLADEVATDCNRPRADGRSSVECALAAAEAGEAFFLAGGRSSFLGRVTAGDYEIVEVSGRVLTPVQWRVCSSLSANTSCSNSECIECKSEATPETLCSP